jgi:hypothetical protein
MGPEVANLLLIALFEEQGAGSGRAPCQGVMSHGRSHERSGR